MCIDQRRYHSLESTDNMGWCLARKHMDTVLMQLKRIYILRKH